MLSSFDKDLNVAVIGASGGIGSALIKYILSDEKVKTVYAFSRSDIAIENPKLIKGNLDLTNETSIERAAHEASKENLLDIIIVATGLLHSDNVKPEKSLRDINAHNFLEVLAINTTGPALIMKYFLPKIRRDRKTVFAAISARVGSISDNYLGGWYAYRASKSALNMLIKTASIEIARKYKQAIVIGLHPGTVETKLSEPFRGNVEQKKLFNPEFSAECLLKVINTTTPDKSGMVFAWDGVPLPN